MIAALAVIYLQTNLMTTRRQSNALSYKNIDNKQSNVLRAEDCCNPSRLPAKEEKLLIKSRATHAMCSLSLINGTVIVLDIRSSIIPVFYAWG